MARGSCGKVSVPYILFSVKVCIERKPPQTALKLPCATYLPLLLHSYRTLDSEICNQGHMQELNCFVLHKQICVEFFWDGLVQFDQNCKLAAFSSKP